MPTENDSSKQEPSTVWHCAVVQKQQADQSSGLVDAVPVSWNRPEPLPFLEAACRESEHQVADKNDIILSCLLGQTIGWATTHKLKQFSSELYLNNSGGERGAVVFASGPTQQLKYKSCWTAQ